jgi:uncharacterized protein (TIGR03118 family)
MAVRFRHWQSPAQAPRAGRRSAPFRPTLDQLEDRCVPSVNTGTYHVTNLVSDQPGVALIQDPNLVNAWGISFSATSPFWVSDNGTGKTTLYGGDVNGSPFAKNPLEVNIPGGLPTGQVFNGSSDFVVHSGTSSGPARFLFASQAGIISGWNPGVPPPPPSHDAQVGATVADAVYTGLAIGKVGTANYLYAANFPAHTIDVFDKDFNLVHLSGSFSDPQLPNSYAPFNVQNLGGKLYVTYAQQSHKNPDEETDHGSGFVDVFDTSGNLLQRLIKGNHLKAPWGVAIAPSNFGPFSNALIVGNFGDGTLHAYNATDGRFLGTLQDESGKPIVIDGVWGITFGNGVAAGDTNALYFAAGPDDETHGLFGSIRLVAGSSARAAAHPAAAAAPGNGKATAARLDSTIGNALLAGAGTAAAHANLAAPHGTAAVEFVSPASPTTSAPSQAQATAVAARKVDPHVVAARDVIFSLHLPPLADGVGTDLAR